MATQHASYIFSAYSFVKTLSKEKLLQVGDQSFEENPIPSFDEDLLIHLCQDVQKIFEKEDNIVNIEGDVIVVGDIHGSFHDLLRIINYIEITNMKALFLGDYVDRGSFSLECITLLFTLKVLKPNQYYLLRGNHEFDSLCSFYGFKKEILNYHNPQKPDEMTKKPSKHKFKEEKHIDFEYDDEFEEEEDQVQLQETRCDDYYANHVNINCYKYTDKLYQSFLRAFSYMPISSIINKSSLCLHGGLTPLLTKIDDIRNNIKRPISNFEENILLSDIMWSDPSENLPSFYCENQRGRGKLFNGTVVVNFLKNNNLKRLIRGHECVQNGVVDLFNEKCFTVFSASSYSKDCGNLSGILKVLRKSDKIESIIFPPVHRLKKYDANYYKVMAFDQSLNHKSMFSICNKKITEYKSGFFSSISHISNTRSDLNIRSYISESDQDLLVDDEVKSSLRKNKNVLFRKMPVLKSGPRKRILCIYSLTSKRNNYNRNPFAIQPKLAPLKGIDEDED